jgi:hypothetical protein
MDANFNRPIRNTYLTEKPVTDIFKIYFPLDELPFAKKNRGINLQMGFEVLTLIRINRFLTQVGLNVDYFPASVPEGWVFRNSIGVVPNFSLNTLAK